MPSPMITNFTAGMLSPRIEGRVDLAKYYNGAKTLENMIVYPFGSATRRPGTEYIATAACNSYAVKLFPFKFSSSQAYVLELGQDTASGSNPGYVRFYYNGAALDGHDKVEMVPNGFFATSTANWTLSGDFTRNATYDYLHKANAAVARTATCTITNCETGISTVYQLNAKVVSISGGNIVVTATDPAVSICTITAAGAVYATFTWTATNSTGQLIFTCASDTVCDITNISLRQYVANMIVDSPYTSAELKDVRFAQQADVVYMVHPDHLPYKLSRWAHRHWTLATFTITSAPADWSAGRGYPQSVAFFEQRLWYGGTETYPQTIWASETGLYDSFDTSGATATRSLSYEIGSSDTVDRIQWLLPHKRLLIGTEGSEWTAGAPNSLEAVAADNIRFIRESSYGSDGKRAELLGNQVVFIGKMGKSLRSFGYSTEADGYTSNNLALLNDFILGDGLTQFAYQQEPASIVWSLTTSNVLLSLTFYPAEQVVAWCQHTTSGTWESIAVIPGSNGNDELWLSTARTMNTSGGTATLYRYIERMAIVGTEEDGATASWYLDCAGQYTAATVHVATLTTTHYTVGATSVDAMAVKTSTAHGLGAGDYCKFFSLNSGTKFNNNSYQVRSSSNATNFVMYASAATNFTPTVGYEREKTNVITGLTWLRGASVDTQGDGAALPTETVTNGATVTIDQRVSDAIVGLGYDSTILSMRMEGGGVQGGVAQGHKKRMSECVVRFYKTIGAQCGISTASSDLQIIPFRSTSDPMDTPIPLFTGDKIVRVPTGFNREGRVAVVQDQPLPMTVLGIIQDMQVEDI